MKDAMTKLRQQASDLADKAAAEAEAAAAGRAQAEEEYNQLMNKLEEERQQVGGGWRGGWGGGKEGGARGLVGRALWLGVGGPVGAAHVAEEVYNGVMNKMEEERQQVGAQWWGVVDWG